MGLFDFIKRLRSKNANNGQNGCKSAEQRKKESIEFLKEQGIEYLESLPCIEDASEVALKDVDVICKKAISTLLIIQVAHDALNNEFEKSKSYFSEEFQRFGVEDYLNKEEKELWNGTYTKQSLCNITWKYETLWALLWALGIIGDDEFKVPVDVMDYMKAIRIIRECKDYDEFKAKVNMRGIEEILDMLDLFYRYHWTTEDARLNLKKLPKINGEVVAERRRGLEWLVSEEEDWNDISLDT